MNQPAKRRDAEAIAVPDEPGEQQRERDEEQQASRRSPRESIDSGRPGIDDCAPASTAALALANTRSIWRRMIPLAGLIVSTTRAGHGISCSAAPRMTSPSASSNLR